MSWFTVEPRDVLMVRDGRAMNGRFGRSLAVPHPPTLAGLLRTRVGTSADGTFDTARINELLREVQCAGPLLARLDGERVAEMFAPAPSDCVWLRDETQEVRGLRLRARRTSDVFPATATDLGAEAWLPFLDDDVPGKPVTGPRFWSWTRLCEWLASDAVWPHTEEATGIGELDRERRIHVAIAPETFTAADGGLFSTEGVRFSGRARHSSGTTAITRWSLLARATLPTAPGWCAVW